MAGTNGLIKFLPVNRDDEAIFFARRNSASLSGNITDFSTAGGSITPTDILNGGFNFVTTASGTFTFPTAAALNTAISTIFPSDIGNSILFSITNSTANDITLDFTGTNVTTLDGQTSLTVYKYSVFEAFLTRLSSSSFRFLPAGYPGFYAIPTDGITIYQTTSTNPAGNTATTTFNIDLKTSFTVPTQVGFATTVVFEIDIRAQQIGYGGALHIDENGGYVSKWLAQVTFENNVFKRSDFREQNNWSSTEDPVLVPANNRPLITALSSAYIMTVQNPRNALLVLTSPTLNSRQFSYKIRVKPEVFSSST